MSRPKTRASDENYLGETLKQLVKTVEEGKFNQPNKIQLSDFFTITLPTLNAGSRWTIHADLFSDVDVTLLAFPEYSFYLGTDAPENELFFDDSGGPPTPWPDRSDIYESWRWSYQDSDGFTSAMIFELKNNSAVPLTNVIFNAQLRYPNLTGEVS